MTMQRDGDVVVIGAGMAGVACARRLLAAGASVRIVEKSRGAGGRSTTRRVGDERLDLGAPYVHTPGGRFRDLVRTCASAGAAAPWRPRIGIFDRGRLVVTEGAATERFVGIPGMSALVRCLASGMEISTGVRVARLELVHGRWNVYAEDGSSVGSFPRVVVAVPAPQAVGLLGAAPGFAEQAAAVRMSSTWSAGLLFDERLPIEVDVGYVYGAPLALLVRDSAKPGRGTEGESWVVHASRDWSADNLERPGEQIAEEILEQLARLLRTNLPAPREVVVHRWRYASAVAPLASDFLVDGTGTLAACGDWCRGTTLEAAFVSGDRLGARLAEG